MMHPLTMADRQRAAGRLGVTENHIQAVLAIEARGSGFLVNRPLPVILFEGHVFWRLTGGKHPASNFNYPKWTKEHYKGGIAEYDRLLRAMEKDEDAALQSASWGLWQIMGFNHKAAGFADVVGFVNAMGQSEAVQLDAGVTLLQSWGLADELRSEAWADFARRYNGSGYRANNYDVKLAQAFHRFSTEDPERDRMRDVQALLNLRLGTRLTVDGWSGPKTAAAIRTYAERVGLPANDNVTPALLSSLGILEAA